MLEQEIKSLVGEVCGTSFRFVKYNTAVKTAAKFKYLVISKEVSANVQVFANLKEFTDIYTAAVKRSAKRISENNMENVEAFIKSDNWFEHSNIFSIVLHKETRKEYLFCLYNNSISKYFINGEETEKKNIIEFLTPNEAKKLTQDNSIIYNKKNDVFHATIARTIGLENIVEFH